MEKSEQIYNVSAAAKGEGGSTYLNTDNNQIEVFVEVTGYQNGLTAHELKHCYQFEKGKISFNKDNGGAGVLYDITDEVEAYNRQSYIEDGTNNKTYTAESVIEFGKRHGIDYSKLPKKKRTIRNYKNIPENEYVKK